MPLLRMKQRAISAISKRPPAVLIPNPIKQMELAITNASTQVGYEHDVAPYDGAPRSGNTGGMAVGFLSTQRFACFYSWGAFDWPADRVCLSARLHVQNTNQYQGQPDVEIALDETGGGIGAPVVPVQSGSDLNPYISDRQAYDSWTASVNWTPSDTPGLSTQEIEVAPLINNLRQLGNYVQGQNLLMYFYDNEWRTGTDDNTTQFTHTRSRLRLTWQ